MCYYPVFSFDVSNLLCSSFRELTTLNVPHQITTTDIFHHKIDSGLCLESGMKIDQEWMSFTISGLEHTSLGTNTRLSGVKDTSHFCISSILPFNFIIINDKSLLQHLDGIQLLIKLFFCQHDLTKITLAKHCQETEIIQLDLSLGHGVLRSHHLLLHRVRLHGSRLHLMGLHLMRLHGLSIRALFYYKYISLSL